MQRRAQSTLVDTFLQTVARTPHKVAMRRRTHGRTRGNWEAISWQQYARATETVAAGLLALGLEPGDRVGIWANNCPEWLFADIGAMRAGAATVPLYPTLIPQQAQHVIAHSDMRVLLVQSAAQQAQVRAMRAACPNLRHVIVLQGDSEAHDLGWDGFLRMGAAYLGQHPGAVQARQAALTPATLATLVYTSGTTGEPKGAMLSHGNLTFEAQAVLDRVALQPREETLSFLPLSHVAERLQGEIMAIAAGMVVNFGRGIDHVREDLLEVRPTLLVCVPRLWEKIHEGICAQLSHAAPRRQKIFAWALAAGQRRFMALTQKRRLPWRQWLQAQLADWLVGRKLRARLGLDRAVHLVSGAAPLAPELQAFFAAWGLPIQEVYGLTECCGILFGTLTPKTIRPGRVGVALDGVEVRIAEDGEICARGPCVFQGYFRDPAGTRAALVDGWLHTGDVGDIDAEGTLRITDRKKDIIVTAGGKNVAPQNIENRIKMHPGVSQAVVLGDKRRYLVALLTVDPAALARVVPQVAGPLSQNPAVREYLEGVLGRVNAELSSFETIKRFEILDEDFTVERGELTPTLKVKRRVIDERYRHVIDGLYAAA